jgi:hypothetical protein
MLLSVKEYVKRLNSHFFSIEVCCVFSSYQWWKYILLALNIDRLQEFSWEFFSFNLIQIIGIILKFLESIQ